MFEFIRKTFITAIWFVGLNCYNTMKYVSMNNHPYKPRLKIVDTNSDEPLYCCTVSISKCAGSCNTILIYWWSICSSIRSKSSKMKCRSQSV